MQRIQKGRRRRTPVGKRADEPVRAVFSGREVGKPVCLTSPESRYCLATPGVDTSVLKLYVQNISAPTVTGERYGVKSLSYGDTPECLFDIAKPDTTAENRESVQVFGGTTDNRAQGSSAGFAEWTV